MDFLKGLPGGGLGGMASMLKNAGQIKDRVERLKCETQSKYFESEAAEGRVKVRMTGFGDLESLHLDTDWLAASDKLVVEGLISSAVNECLRKVKDNLKSEAEGLASEYGLPGI